MARINTILRKIRMTSGCNHMAGVAKNMFSIAFEECLLRKTFRLQIGNWNT